MNQNKPQTISSRDAPDWWKQAGAEYKAWGMRGPDGYVYRQDGKKNSGQLTRTYQPGSTPMDVINAGMARTKIIQQEQAKRDRAAADAQRSALGGLAGGLGGKTPQTPQTGSYQSSINVGGGIGKGGVLAGLLDTGSSSNPNVSAFMRATSRNDASQIGRAVDGQNQQLFMDQQAKRAESTTQGASNLAQIYGDYAERGIAQIGLASDILKNNLGFAGGLASMGMRGMS